MTQKIPPITVKWTKRDETITTWLTQFPESIRETVIKEVLKDYILYGETDNPIPTVQALKNSSKQEVPAEANDTQGETSLNFTQQLKTVPVSTEKANEKLNAILQSL
ncbi:MAG: hypothetical protein H0Z35_05950 [Thermoanaerobacteraceae bacterium]|nr:hypothetical protein [Thermoanaerobacteraceae bacterium]